MGDELRSEMLFLIASQLCSFGKKQLANPYEKAWNQVRHSSNNEHWCNPLFNYLDLKFDNNLSHLVDWSKIAFQDHKMKKNS